MTHHVSRQLWATIDFDDVTGQVFVQQDWQYRWLLWPGVTQAWTLREKQAAHRRIDRAIWATWSNRLALKVRATGRRPTQFGARAPLNFDVRWKIGRGNWTVILWKMPPGADPMLVRSNVQWVSRTIELSSADLGKSTAVNAAGATTTEFQTVPHEFAHTFLVDDEYDAGDRFLSDTSSIANIGRQVRSRHLLLIVNALNTMMPDMAFTA